MNALVQENSRKAGAWKNTRQRQRRLATALLEIEPRLRRTRGHRRLPQQREALDRDLEGGR